MEPTRRRSHASCRTGGRPRRRSLDDRREPFPARAELGSAERAKLTHRRKVIDEEQHPQTCHGGGQNRVAKMATRSPTGSPRTSLPLAVRASAPSGVTPSAARRSSTKPSKMLNGTKLDNGAYLDQIKRTAPTSAKIAKVESDLAADDKPQAPKPDTERKASKIDLAAGAENKILRAAMEYIAGVNDAEPDDPPMTSWRIAFRAYNGSGATAAPWRHCCPSSTRRWAPPEDPWPALTTQVFKDDWQADHRGDKAWTSPRALRVRPRPNHD